MEPRFGAQPSKPDYRDFRSSTLSFSIPPVTKADVSKLDITDQGQLGICTSNLAYYIEYLYYKKTGVYTKLSRRFLYTMTKVAIDNDPYEGSQMRSALKAAAKYGVCTEATYPSDTAGFSHEEYINVNSIPAAAFVEAQNYRIGSYLAINIDPVAIGGALAKYGLLFARYEVGKEWWSKEDGSYSMAEKDIAPLRPPKEVISGHAVVLCGYDFTDTSDFDVMNSWGTQWCKSGICYHSTNNMPTEAWAVSLDIVKNDLPSPKDFKYTFTKSMTRGSSGKEVLNLQIALMISGDLEYVQPKDRGFYGAKTQKAVYDFQRRVGIPASSFGLYCGPKTLAALNAIYSK